MTSNLRWDTCVALGVGAVLAALMTPIWVDREYFLYHIPSFWFDSLEFLALPGDLADSGPGVSFAKFVAVWMFYAAGVFIPFRIESMFVPNWHSSGRRDIRILRTSTAMLLLAGAVYCVCRFREKPGGLDGGLGDLIVISWLAPVLLIGASVALAAALHVVWRSSIASRRRA